MQLLTVLNVSGCRWFTDMVQKGWIAIYGVFDGKNGQLINNSIN